jgi:hypothetical protein
MQRRSDVIETRVRLRFDVVASPHLHELFGSVDATRHATLVALMLERCVAYDRAFAGQAHGLIDPRQLQSRETLGNAEGPRNRSSITNDNGASQPPAPIHLNDRNTNVKPAPAPAPVVAADGVNSQVKGNAEHLREVVDSEDSTQMHDPADMAMALGGLGL